MRNRRPGLDFEDGDCIVAGMTQANSRKRVAVVGGGITGLTAAYRLAAGGHEVTLLEQSDRLGGSIRTERIDGWLVEGGPNSLLEGEEGLSELIRDLGLEGELQAGGAAAKNRFIVRKGRLQALPMSPPALLTTRLYSVGMRLRVFAEMLQKPRKRGADVSLQQLILDHFGREAVDYGLNPFVGGVYAGDPERLSARHSFPKLWEIEQTTGSIIRGQMAAAKERKAAGRPRPRIVSFRAGLAALPEALASRLPVGAVRLGSRVARLERTDGWTVVWTGASGTEERAQFDDVVLAAPAGALAKLAIGPAGERPLAGLSEVMHPPVTSLFLGFKREQVRHPLDGFGALIPAVEGRQELGILFSSSLFEGRAPAGHVALTVMVGGMRQPELARLDRAALWDAVKGDLRELLGVEGEPVFSRYNAWPAAIPQYNLGYEHVLDAIAACERSNPGLHIGGNVRDGIAVPSCIGAGLRLAAEVDTGAR